MLDKDLLDRKEQEYGKYEYQSIVISDLLEALDKLTDLNNIRPLTRDEVVDYTILFLKITRSVMVNRSKNRDAIVDTWVDLANYARLMCRKRTNVDIFEELNK